MKKNIYTFSFLALSFTTMAQVGINNPNPDGSAQLDIVSTQKGILIPRMTVTERNNISTPAEGLMVFQTGTDAGFYYYSQGLWHYNKPATIANVALVPNAKGAVIDMNGNISLTPANASNSGIVSPGTQSFGGQKTFTGPVTINGAANLTSNLNVAGNSTINNSLTVGGNVTTASAFIGKGAITYIPGPINTADYTNGNVVYAEDEGAFYFFKTGSIQSSAAWNNADGGFAEAPFGDNRHVVMRFRSTGTSIKTINLSAWGGTNSVLSLYAAVLPCSSYAQVDPATLVASSSPSSNGEYNFPANTITAGTDYYLQFTADPPNSFGVNIVTDPNFGSSYGYCGLNDGVPAMQIIYNAFIKL